MSGGLGDAVRAILADTLNLPPEFLDYTRQYAALNPISTARTSGTRVAIGTRSSSVTTTGTTFGTGADVLANPLTFTADGKTNYVVRISAPDWLNTTVTNFVALCANIDGLDQGVMAVWGLGAGESVQCAGSGFLNFPASGSHTVNVRMFVGAGTGQIDAGNGGPGTKMPIIVTLEVA